MSQLDKSGCLLVEVLSAAEVPKDRFKKNDPYVVLFFKGVKLKTSCKKTEINPVWNEKLEFDLKNTKLTSADSLEVHLKDYESLGNNKLLGKGVVPLGQLLRCESLKCQVDLYDSLMNKLNSKVFVNIEYKAPPAATAEAAGEHDDSGFLNDSSSAGSTSSTGGENKATGESDLRFAARRDTKKQRLQKVQDFQIRIKVIEARQLDGNNIHPLCCIRCSSHVKYTKTIRSTNSPYWDEVFFFNYRRSPAELLDETIEFQVFNSLKYRRDSLIGSFKTDIGFIYDEPNHSVNRKWLLLADSSDELTGAKGYLKVSINVLGPGDEIPNSADMPQDEDDIENNLLKPTGIMLRPATLVMKAYRAEDLPRMDSNILQGIKEFIGSNDQKKDLVDPYVLFSFAGKKVQSKVVYNSANPEWNQELKVGMKFPSLCDKITISLKDWDRSTKDDMISTVFMNLQDISDSTENGFLPTFGPCFLNVYGGPREYSELPTKFDELNYGKGEGVAYRGRVLFELKTILGELPDEPLTEMKHSETMLIDLYLRRQKYKLHAVFLDATMISDIDKPIEFEVSIGNYGNRLDENEPPSSSTTPPSNAVFDGCSYYFLPWDDIKPSIQITSYWEDISFRIEAANQLHKLRLHISECIQLIKALVKTFGGDVDLNSNEIKHMALAILEKIEVVKLLASMPLSEPVSGRHHSNELDRLMLNSRLKFLQDVFSKCEQLRTMQFKHVLENLPELENLCDLLEKLENEPQNSIPDVIIWMICGNERTAYHRIPARDLFFSSNSDGRGDLCGALQTITLKWPGKEAEEKAKKHSIPAQLRLKLWFGLEKDENDWLQSHRDETRHGAVTIFAETYENQNFSLISRSWTYDGVSRPKFSDASGKSELRKDKFELPTGWEWASEWKVAPELSMLFEKDAGHSHFMEEVYEQQSRLLPGATWSLGSEDKSPYSWADYKGEKSRNKELFQLHDNWQWRDDWNVDINRAVDHEGWEYCVDLSLGGWSPSEKIYHLLRRRRWVRNRIVVVASPETSSTKPVSALGSFSLLMVPDSKKTEFEETLKDGWEYARGFLFKFHAKEKQSDMVRRRRWHRQMRPSSKNNDLTAIFRFNNTQSIESSNEKSQQVISLNAPRMFMKFKKPHKFQMRAYIYQARSLQASDSDTSLSDPYCVVSFITQSSKTEVIKRTLTPTWDQTLIFECVNIYSDLSDIFNGSTKVVVEVFDHDTYGSADFLGRCVVTPKLRTSENLEQTMLEWFKIRREGDETGEVLAAFDLFHLDSEKSVKLPNRPPVTGALYRVPSGIKPVLQRTIIEVLCWGLRNMKSFQLSDIDCPQIVFECGDHRIESEVLKNARINMNFSKPALYFDIMLPKEEMYTPPLTIKVLDHRNFGRKPTVGVHCINSVAKYRVDRSKKEFIQTTNADSIVKNDRHGQVVLAMEESKTVVEEDIDWWSKFYASLNDLKRCGSYITKGYEKITIFEEELENVRRFEHFADFCETFRLLRGKTTNNDEESEAIGEFKGMFKVYPVTDGMENDMLKSLIYQNVQLTNREECIVRVYVVRGQNLQPKDSNGKSDPYIQIINGKTKIDSRDNYIPNTNDPEFGRMFEIKAVLPLQKDLCIRVKDFDMISSDEIIGETWIDLEDRLLTKHRATCGLPKVYNESGPNKWRDSRKPSEILANICKNRNLSFTPGESLVRVGDQVFHLESYEKDSICNPYAGPKGERLCLYILHEFKLVPEHVETRKLYNPIQPGIEQGRLQMWVDVYPLSMGMPGPAFDIRPRKPKSYVLRCIIWNTKDVPFDETSITGEKMSDIYVKGWLQGLDTDRQKTDVHYRSMDGDGYFNWRFVFEFDYLPAEQIISIKKKDHFWSLDETQSKLPPILNFQIWDNDKFSADDFIGQMTLNLNNMIKPVKDHEKCGLAQLSNTDTKSTSLFEQRRMKGWWPCTNGNGKRKMAGKIEMELELLTEDEAKQRPAGRGREAPNDNPKLEEPNRPDTSFLWLTSPYRTFKYILWRRYKWGFLAFLFILLLVLFVILMLYTMPSAIWSNVVFRHLP